MRQQTTEQITACKAAGIVIIFCMALPSLST